MNERDSACTPRLARPCLESSCALSPQCCPAMAAGRGNLATMANKRPSKHPPPASVVPPTLQKTAILVRELEKCGYGAEDLLEGSGLSRDEALDVQADISWNEFVIVSRNALRLTGDPALGLWLGRHIKLASLGIAGLAALSSPSLVEAAMIVQRYASLVVTHIRAELEFVPRDGGDGLVPTLRVDEVEDFSGLRVYLIESVIRFIADTATTVNGGKVKGLRFDVTYAEPEHWSSTDFEYPVRFDMPHHRVYADDATNPLFHSSPSALRALQPLLEQQLETRERDQTVVERTLGFLKRAYDAGPADLPGAAEMADLLGYSERSLRRALNDEGTSFREVLDAFRRETAEAALASGTTSVTALASRLGYRDCSNFRRAFRRWTGSNPSDFQRRHEQRTPED